MKIIVNNAWLPIAPDGALTQQRPGTLNGFRGAVSLSSERYQTLPDSFSRSAASCSSLASDPPVDAAPVETEGSLDDAGAEADDDE